MKKVHKIKIILTCMLVSSFMLALFAGPVSAALLSRTLTVGSGSGDYNDVVSLPITVDNAAKVYGAAFTLTYDPGIFDFQGLVQVTTAIDNGDDYSGNPDKYTPEYVQDTLFFQANEDDVNGKILVAVASAQELANTTLLKAKFLIRDGTDAKGTYPVTLVRTIITNPEAGYTQPTYIPFLASAPAMTPNAQGYYPVEDQFKTTPFNGSIIVDPQDPPGYSISGTVTYGAGGDPANNCPVVLKKLVNGTYQYSAAKTVSNGSYTFTDKLNGEYRVYVTSLNPNYYNTYVAVNVVDAAVDNADVVLPSPIRISGSAGTVQINGGYLPGLKVKIVNNDTGQVWVYAVNPNGSFMSQPLPPGNYSCYAVYGSLSNALTLNQANPWTTDLNTIGGTIAGLQPGGQATVSVRSFDGKLQKTEPSLPAASNGDATYSIDNLVPEDDYYASAVGPGTFVIYFDQKTDITMATPVDISAGDNPNVNFDFSGDKGSVSGLVEEGSGNPVEDIAVFAFEQSTYALSAALTDASGIYTLTLPPGRYEIFVIKLNGKVFYYADTLATQNPANATIITVEQGGSIENINIDIEECDKTLTGKVTYERSDGPPVAGALIRATSADSRSVAVTDQMGAYILTGLCDVVKYTIEMTPPDNHLAIQTTSDVGAGSVVNFIVDTGHKLSGTVKDSVTSGPVDKAAIYLIDQETHALVGGHLYFSDAEDGGYSIGDIPTGIYTLMVQHPLYQTDTETDLVINADANKDISLVQGAHFYGQVLDGENDNAPLPKALIIAVREGADPVCDLTNGNGDYAVYGLDETQDDYIIVAQKRGYVRQIRGNKTPVTDVGEPENFTLNYPVSPFNLRGTITSGCEGTPPVPNAVVVVLSASQEFFAGTRTDSDGDYAFENLPQSDDYRFVVVPGGGLQTDVKPVVDFTGLADVDNYDVELPCGSSISGIVTWNGASAAHVLLYKFDGTDNTFVDFTTIDTSGGSYTFTGLADGNYKVLAVAVGNTPEWYNAQFSIGDATPVNVPGDAGTSIDIDMTN